MRTNVELRKPGRAAWLVPVAVALCLAPRPGRGAPSVSRARNAAEQEIYVLENEFLRLEVNPAHGGRAQTLFCKRTGTALTLAASTSAAPAGSGLFVDRFWGRRQIRRFERSAYEAQVRESGPHKAALALVGAAQDLRIEKTLTLERGVSSVRVDYRITNEGSQDYVGRFWVVNSVFPGPSPEALLFFYPYGMLAHDTKHPEADPTIPELIYRPGEEPANSNNLVSKPARAWGAVTSSGGAGAAFEVDYGFLKQFYSYHPPPGAGVAVPTFEWWCRPIKLPPIARGRKDAVRRPELEDPLQGYVFRTSWRLIPFTGFTRVSGAKQGIVGAVEVPGDKVAVKLLADRDRQARVEVRRTILGRSGNPAQLGTKAVQLKADEPQGFSLPATHGEPGTYVYQVVVRDAADGRELLAFETPYVHQTASAPYVLEPCEPKNTLLDPGLEVPELGQAFPDECVKWAKPLEKPLKALVISPLGTHREIGELVRRLDAEVTLVETVHPHVFKFTRDAFASWTPPDPEALLADALKQEFDVILIGASLLWDRIPKHLQAGILAKVEQGTGLVYVHPRSLEGELKKLLRSKPLALDDDRLFAGIPHGRFPGMERFPSLSDACEVRRHGQGAVVALKYNTVPNGRVWRTSRALTPAIEDDGDCLFPYWEYYYSLVCRCLLFAAGRTPSVRIVEATVEQGNATIRIQVDNKEKGNAEVAIAARVRNRRWDNAGAGERRASLAPGLSTVSVPITGARFDLRGPHFVNVILTRGGKVADWHTTVKDVARDAALTGVTLDAFAHRLDQPVSGRCEIELEPAAPAAPTTLRRTISDVHGRMLAREEELLSASAKGGTASRPFRLRLQAPPLSTLCWLEAELLRDGTVVDYARTHLVVERPRHRDVTFTVWGMLEANHWTKRRVAERMGEIGFDVSTGLQMSAVKEREFQAGARNALAAGLDVSPMQIHRLAVWQKQLESPVRDPCLTDPAYHEKMATDIHDHVSWTKRFLCPFFFVADENSLGHYSSPHDFCRSPTCLDGFRRKLQARYDSLDALNRAWRTEFAAWDQVAPDTFAQAKERNWFASWTEHRRFMFDAFAGAMALEKKLLEQTCPNGRLAVSGMGMPTVHNGFDWRLMQQHLDHVVGYIRPCVTDMMRSFKRPDSTLSAWNGYGASAPMLRQRVWHQVLNGFCHPSYWYHRYMIGHGDDSLSQAGREFQQIIAEVRDSGLGKLLIESAWAPSAVGVHQSTASLIVAHATGTFCTLNDSVFASNLNGWSELVRDMGFQPPTYVATDQLENGALSPAATPVFVLPLSQALSDGEVRALRDYVSAGGILVADARPGVYGVNGVPQQANPLHAVFGVSYGPDPFERPATKIAVRSGQREQTTPLSAVDPDLRVLGGKALGGSKRQGGTRPVDFGGLKIKSGTGQGAAVPAFVVNQVGKGWAVYLNTLLDEYPDLRKRGETGVSVGQTLRSVLEGLGLRRDLRADLPPGTELIRRRDGANLYLGACRIMGCSGERNRFTIDLTRPAHVYDLATHACVGETSRIEGAILPGQTRLFALTPAKLAPVRVEADLVGNEIEVRLALADVNGRPAAGGARVMVYGPDGKERRCHSRNCKVRDGAAKVKAPLALNERNGVWRVKVRDTVTGSEKETTVEVRN